LQLNIGLLYYKQCTHSNQAIWSKTCDDNPANSTPSGLSKNFSVCCYDK